MDIPKDLVSKNKDGISEKKESLLEGRLYREANVIEIVEGFEKFFGKPSDPVWTSRDKTYGKAQKIISELNYSKYDLQVLCDKLIDYEPAGDTVYGLDFMKSGYYLSALINKIIEEHETITLKLPELEKRIAHVGSHLNKGRLIIEGNLGAFAGEWMDGGILMVEGDTGSATGYNLRNGEIHARHVSSIESMWGGKLYAKSIDLIHENYSCSSYGEIYEANVRVR